MKMHFLLSNSNVHYLAVAEAARFLAHQKEGRVRSAGRAGRMIPATLQPMPLPALGVDHRAHGAASVKQVSIPAPSTTLPSVYIAEGRWATARVFLVHVAAALGVNRRGDAGSLASAHCGLSAHAPNNTYSPLMDLRGP